MSSDFEPANELETALVAAQRGELPVVEFLDKLRASQVFVLLNKDPGPQWDSSATPMVLTSQTGQPVLAVFTAPERSAAWREREPLFRFGLLADLSWLLGGLAPGVGMVVNPGLAAGLEMPPDGVAQLKARAKRR